MMAILSALGGAFVRMLPEIMSLFNKKTDNSHELALMDKQIELEKIKSENKIKETEAEGDVTQAINLIEAQKAAVEGQMQKVGIWIVDVLNFLVRPYIAYTSITFYYLAKIAMFLLAYQNGLSTWDGILKIYTEEDFNLVVGVINFYLVGRVIDKKK